MARALDPGRQHAQVLPEETGTMPFETIGSPALWAGFVVFVMALLAVDLGVFHKQAHEVSFKEAAWWSGVWVGLAAFFRAASSTMVFSLWPSL